MQCFHVTTLPFQESEELSSLDEMTVYDFNCELYHYDSKMHHAELW